MISPEKLGEFDGLSVEMISLIRQSRSEKVELRLLERDRALAAISASQRVLDRIDERVHRLDASRVQLLHSIARLVPGYSVALAWAVKNMGFDPDMGTVRYYKRRGCFTFGMPGRPVMAVCVHDGEVIRADEIDW